MGTMRDWHQGVQALHRQSMHGHLLVDLFADGRSGFRVFRQYCTVLYNVVDLLEFQSNFINDYFRDLWLNRTKLMLRLAIKFFIITCTLIVVEPTLICPVNKIIKHTYWNLSFAGFLTFYLYTFRNISHDMYANMGLAICILHIIAQLPLRCEIYSRNAPLLSPAFVTIFTTFAMLPIRLELAFCLVTVFLVILEALDLLYDTDVFLRSQVDLHNIYTGRWVNFDLSRLTTTFSRLVARSQKVLSMRLVLWIIVCVAAIYIRAWNTIRRRYAFYKLGKSVQARSQCIKAHQGRVNWIEAVMPLQVSEEYQRMRKLNDHFNVTDWVYIRTYENVSVLFADVVGFTTLSSKLTALQIVTVLGELITKFDEVCQATHCEKIGVLGDCYYCTAGCLEYQPNNAMCCTEMGLGMCEILRLYNADHQYAVNIRVGVHTGRVHTAILGSQRFRFDVYSYDVMIANELESTGRPGCVHISQDTYDYLQDVYSVTPGPDLVVDKRDTSFLRRRTAASVRIRTYFIEPGTISSMFRKSEGESKLHGSSNTLTETSEQSTFGWSSTATDDETDDHSEIEGEDEGEVAADSSVWADFEMSAEALADIKLSHQTNVVHLKRDMAFIDDLRSDPAKHSLLFRSPPVSSVLLHFTNPEVEWHYQLHIRQKLGPTYVDSEKLARVVDTMLIFVVIVVLCFLGIMNKCEKVAMIVYAVAMTTGIIIFATLWLVGTNYPETIRLDWIRSYYIFCSHPIVRELLMGTYTCLPTIINLANRFSVLAGTDSGSTDYLQGVMNYISLLVHCLPSASAAWARTLFCTLSLILLSIFWIPGTYDELPYTLCLSHVVLSNGLLVDRLIISHYCQLLVCLALVIVLARENERICKLCFYVHREAEIESEAEEKAVQEANDLLYNIIPAYVFEELNETGRGEFTSTSQLTLRYAVGHVNVGVAFVSISNFFATLYREDQGGGERSLRSLHKIICSFDELMRKPEYKDVEKIKSMHENYLCAAGLNRKLLGGNRDPCAHLVALMNYCFDARQVVQSFHTYELQETGPLVPKLGFNCGPLTAGIIGTTKPHYDIWGDTVNVASRMCYNSIPGAIQVPQWVRDKLYMYFPFKYRGEIFIKGKGMMRVYLCDTAFDQSDSSPSRRDNNE